MEQRTDAFKLTIITILALILFLGFGLGPLQSLNNFGLSARAEALAQVSQPIYRVNDFIDTLRSLQGLSGANQELKDRVASNEAELARLRVLEEQNAWLLSQMGSSMALVTGKPILPVIRFSQGLHTGEMTVAVGEVDVKPGDLLANFNYIVAEIESVADGYAVAKLVTSSTAKFPVKVGESGDVGNLVGDSGIGMKVINISAVNRVKLGDVVVPLNSPDIQSGYRFGEVSAVIGEEVDPESELQITSPIDLYKLKYVFLLAIR